jgi:hypothetical protein
VPKNRKSSRRKFVSTDSEKLLVKGVKERLDPPTTDELNQAIAKLLFGKNAEKMLEHAPWSFLLTKLMWVKGDEPWEKSK